jgi:putative PIN family toxin of toxin-antitoxin system
MLKVVIDTNIIISYVINANGNPAEIMQFFYSGKLQLFYSVKIMMEYKKVLSY